MIDGSRAYAQLNDNALIKTAEQIFAQVDAASDRSHIQPVLFLEINQSLVQTADPDTQKLEQLISFWRQKKRILYGQIVGLTHAIVRKIFLFLESTLPSLMIALREMVPSAPQLLGICYDSTAVQLYDCTVLVHFFQTRSVSQILLLLSDNTIMHGLGQNGTGENCCYNSTST
eukprot:COSAG01_NODE_11783_length_1859_cov_7.051136_1_plen_173_part_00